jgi:DNA-binding response OmpR family regulator
MATEQMIERRVAEGARVLVASADAQLRHQLAADLIEHGLWLTAARSEATVLHEVSQHSVDLLVLDWGEETAPLVEAVRQLTQAPVIALVREGNAAATVAAFDAGADDCATWPLDPLELGRRIEALLRRSRAGARTEDVIEGPRGLRLRPRAHEAYVGDAALDLTPKEFMLLQLLLEHRNEVLTADDVSGTLWGHATYGAQNFVEAHISRLRGKLRAAGAGDAITTVRGVGYKIR